MTIEQVFVFFEEYTLAEFDAEIKARSHPNAEVATAAVEATRRFFHGFLFDAGIFYRGSADPAETEEEARRFFQRRLVFGAIELELPEGGSLYCVLASLMIAGDRNATSLFYLKVVPDRGLRIVGRYNICNDCHQTGKVKRRVCSECHGKGICWRGGIRAPDDARVIDVVPFPAGHPAQGGIDVGRLLKQWKYRRKL